MASIRSVLIKTCMANIQKEMNHLEHWLHHLPEESSSSVGLNTVEDEMQEARSSMDLQMIYRAVDKISKQLGVQQLTLNHITDRIEVLENMREYSIQKPVESSPWLGPALNDSVQNEAMCETLEDDIEPLIHVVHMDDPVEEPKEEPKEDTAAIQAALKKQQEEEEAARLKKKQEEEEAARLKKQQEEEDARLKKKQEEEDARLKKKQEEEDARLKKKQQEEEAAALKQQEEEEVEEEGEEFSEIEYKGVTYYLDSSNQVYSVDEEGQPSEMAIGFWKEKSQTIAFYKVK